MFLNNRHYDPSAGVFINVDPLVTITGEPYIYGSANPVTYSDPDGLQPCATSSCPDGIPVVQNGKADHRAWRWTRLNETVGKYQARELFALDKSSDPLPAWGLPGNPEGPTRRRYSFTFDISESAIPADLATLLIENCQFQFPVDGCRSNFREGDRFPLHRDLGERGRLDLPVEITEIYPDGFLFTSLDGHPEGAGAQIQFRFRRFDGATYLKVDAWGPSSFLTSVPIVADLNFFFIERNWAVLASNMRELARHSS